jgi:hypothetical protein
VSLGVYARRCEKLWPGNTATWLPRVRLVPHTLNWHGLTRLAIRGEASTRRTLHPAALPYCEALSWDLGRARRRTSFHPVPRSLEHGLPGRVHEMMENVNLDAA